MPRAALVWSGVIRGDAGIEQLRSRHLLRVTEPGADERPSTSAAVRSLSARLKSEREAYRRELSQLQLALAKAQGENLELRAQTAPRRPRGLGLEI